MHDDDDDDDDGFGAVRGAQSRVAAQATRLEGAATDAIFFLLLFSLPMPIGELVASAAEVR
jgi:hypothetical protein